MRYNLYFFAGGRTGIKTLLSEEDLDCIINAYAEGLTSFFINGTSLDFNRLQSIKIFDTNLSDDEFRSYEDSLESKRQGSLSPIWSPETFGKIGKEITKSLIENKSFGWRKNRTLISNSEQHTNTFWALIHDKIKAVAKPRFDSKQYADAVEASFKELNDLIKQEYKSKTGTELDGQNLMQQAFKGNPPTFELVDQSNQNGQNIQEGYRFILAGSMIGIRNPKAHKNLVIDQSDALEKIVLASHLMKVFENRLNP